METKSNNPRLKQSEIAKELAISISTLQRNRKEINMYSSYRMLQSTSTHTKKNKTFQTKLSKTSR